MGSVSNIQHAFGARYVLWYLLTYLYRYLICILIADCFFYLVLAPLGIDYPVFCSILDLSNAALLWHNPIQKYWTSVISKGVRSGKEDFMVLAIGWGVRLGFRSQSQRGKGTRTWSLMQVGTRDRDIFQSASSTSLTVSPGSRDSVCNTIQNIANRYFIHRFLKLTLPNIDHPVHLHYRFANSAVPYPDLGGVFTNRCLAPACENNPLSLVSPYSGRTSSNSFLVAGRRPSGPWPGQLAEQSGTSSLARQRPASRISHGYQKFLDTVSWPVAREVSSIAEYLSAICFSNARSWSSIIIRLI